MLNKNFKKTIAVLSAAAMLAGITGPAVLADDFEDYTEEEIAELFAEGEAEIYYSADYEDESASDWATTTSGRFDPTIEEDADGNHYFTVKQGTRYNNGATVKGSVIYKGSTYVMEFDAKLHSSNGQAGTEFKIVSGEKGYILDMKQASNDSTSWTVNGKETVTLPKSNSISDTTLKGIESAPWYHYIIMQNGEVTTLTIKDAGGQVIFPSKVIPSETDGTGVAGIEFATSRYNANIAMDNIIIRSLTDEETVAAAVSDIDITDKDGKIYADGDEYSVVTDFSVPVSISGCNISWTVTDENGNSTDDITVAGNTVSLVSPSSDKKYSLNAEITKGSFTAEAKYVIKYIPADTVLEDIKASFDPFNGNYEVTADRELPVSSGVAKVEWTSSDNDLVSVDSDGNMTVYPKKAASDVVLTAKFSLLDSTAEKSFTIDITKYYEAEKEALSKEFDEVILYPNITNGAKMASVTLSEKERALISYDVDLAETGSSNDYKVVWESSDINYLTPTGVIGVLDKDSHSVTLKRTVSLVKDGDVVLSETREYPVSVQFDPDEMADSIDEIVKNYAESLRAAAAEDARVKYAKEKNSDTTSEDYKKAYESAKGQAAYDEAYDSADAKAKYDAGYKAAIDFFLYRLQTRGDSAYEKNFEDIPTYTDDDFAVNTEGYFGSTISWTSSDDSIRISGKNAKVTQKTSDRTATLKASVMAGSSMMENIYSTEVTVDGKGGSSKSSGGGGSSSSGGGNSYRGSLGTSAYVAVPTPAPVAPNASVVNGDTVNIQSRFKDLLDVAWAAEAIEALAEKGIVSGKDDTRFAPNDNITRAELSKIITGAFGIDTGAAASFSDTASDAWYAPFVGACAAAGIVTGYEDGTFRPDNLVSRQEMAVMIKRAADFAGAVIAAQNAKADFTDEAAIADYAAEAIETLQMAGMINGLEDGSFAPNATATRAQAAKILYNFAK